MADGTRENPFDVVVIGGGVNGCGIARDCAMRDLSVALFEKRDFSTGATGSSTGMIHGGLRYLHKDPDVTRKSCVDSGYIQKIAPHLLFRIPFLMPFQERDKHSRILLEFADVYFRAYDQYATHKGGQPHCRLTGEEVRALEPGLRADVHGAVTTDEWGIDTQRITLINALDAERRGAAIHTWHDVVDLIREPGRVHGVRVRDRIDGGEREVFARVVFNATGPWGERFANRFDVRGLRVRPGKGVHLVFAGRLTNYAVITRCIDGRRILLCPHQNTTIVGPTDDDYYGDLDNIPVLRDEVEYLLEGIASVFPSIRRHRIIDTWAGCRPTLYAWGPNEDDLSRDHRVLDHADEGAEGFMSITGGKLAAFRLMSADATDRIVARLGVGDRPCQTHLEPLPGGAEHDLALEAFVELGVDRLAASRILYRHGSEAHGVLALMREQPRWRRVIDPSEPITEAELRYVMRHEHVRTLDDCQRRVRLGCGPDTGMRTALLAAHVFADERDLAPSAVPDIALQFQAYRFQRRRAILQGTQLAQEELGMGWMMEAAGLGSVATHFVVPGIDAKPTAPTRVDANATEPVRR